jgi:hypothetical protein
MDLNNETVSCNYCIHSYMTITVNAIIVVGEENRVEIEHNIYINIYFHINYYIYININYIISYPYTITIFFSMKYINTKKNLSFTMNFICLFVQ